MAGSSSWISRLSILSFISTMGSLAELVQVASCAGSEVCSDDQAQALEDHERSAATLRLLQHEMRKQKIERRSNFGLDSVLWTGADSNLSYTSRLEAASYNSNSGAGTVSAWPTQIMGHYNTGTNLLSELLAKNFPDNMSVVDSQTTAVGACTFWKHSSLSVLESHDPAVFETCKGRVIGLAMVRNPLSWLSSFKRVAYDLYECNDGSDWLTRPCEYPLGTPSYLGGQLYSNVEDIWNAWTRDYDSLADFGFDHGLLIRYEDLVLRTEEELGRIAEVANLTVQGAVEQVDENMSPTSDHEDDGRDAAIDQIQSKSYLSDFSSDELIQACSRLSAELMAKHGYDDCVTLLASQASA